MPPKVTSKLLRWNSSITIFMLIVFPFHALLLSYVPIPNIWRQATSWMWGLVILTWAVLNMGAGKRLLNMLPQVRHAGIILTPYLLLTVLGVVSAEMNGGIGIIETNALLLALSFLPLALIIAILPISQVNRLLRGMFWVGIVAALYGLAEQYAGVRLLKQEFLSENNLIGADGTIRSGSIFGDALSFGPYLAITLMIGLQQFGKTLGWQRIIIVLGILLMLVGIWVSGVRAALVIVLIGWLVYIGGQALFSPGRKNFLRVLMTGGILSLFIGSSVFLIGAINNGGDRGYLALQTERLANIFDSQDRGNVGRIERYALVEKTLSRDAYTALNGAGYGLSSNINPNLITDPALWQKRFSAENNYLKTLYEQGIIGLIFFLIFLGIWGWMAFQTMYLAGRHQFLIPESALCLSLWFMLTIHMWIVPTLNSPTGGILVFTAIGLTIAVKHSIEMRIIKMGKKSI